MIFCYGCGKEMHETAAICPSCGARQKAGNGLKYTSYDQVPWYRKNWFAILSFFVFMPALFLVLLTGSIYYERGGEVKKYSTFAKIFLLLYSLIPTIFLAAYLAKSNQGTQIAQPIQSVEAASIASIAEPAGNDKGSASNAIFTVPDNLKKLRIVVNSSDTRVTFGQYMELAEEKGGVNTTVAVKGNDYIVHHVFPDKINGNDEEIGMQFTPQGDFIVLGRITDDQMDVDPEDMPTKFMQTIAALAPDRNANQASSNDSEKVAAPGAAPPVAQAVDDGGAIAARSGKSPVDAIVVTQSNSSTDQATSPTPPSETAAVMPVQATVAPVKPSFDCLKASSVAEKLICINNDLATEDQKLMQSYKAALAQSSDKVALKAEQNAWRIQVRDICTDVTCVSNAYSARMNQLARQ